MRKALDEENKRNTNPATVAVAGVSASSAHRGNHLHRGFIAEAPAPDKKSGRAAGWGVVTARAAPK
jgi:hypothetical protein